MHELNELLAHSGIKGMRWGVRNDRPTGRLGPKKQNADKKSKPKAESTKKPKTDRSKIIHPAAPNSKQNGSKLGKRLDSWQRERQWHKVLNDVHNMSTKDMGRIQKRISLENNLKTLSKSRAASKKDKEDYLNRHKMTDQELNRKITRLRAKDSLHKAVKESSKEQREFGKKVAQVGGHLAIKFALNRTITPRDIFEAVVNPKIKGKQDAYETGVREVQRRSRNQNVKDYLETAKHIKVSKPKS